MSFDRSERELRPEADQAPWKHEGDLSWADITAPGEDSDKSDLSGESYEEDKLSSIAHEPTLDVRPGIIATVVNDFGIDPARVYSYAENKDHILAPMVSMQWMILTATDCSKIRPCRSLSTIVRQS